MNLYLLFSRYVRRQVRELRRQLQAIGKVSDPDVIHDARVACRRLRVALAVLRDLLPRRLTKKWKLRQLRRDLRDFARALGQARDLDVHIGRVKKWASTVKNAEEKAGVRWVVRELQTARKNSQSQVLEAAKRLEQTQAVKRLKQWSKFLADSVPKKGELAEIVGQSEEVLRGYLGAVARSAEISPHSRPVEELHELRITFKKLRYFLELFSDANKKSFEPAIAECRKIQEDLGDFCDAVNGAEMVKTLLEHAKGNPGKSSPSQHGSAQAQLGIKRCLEWYQSLSEVALNRLAESLNLAKSDGPLMGISLSQLLQPVGASEVSST